MAMSKTGYVDAQRGTTKAKVDLNEDGQIAQPGDAVAGTKYFTINQVNPENSLVQNTKVIDLFIGFANGSADSLSNKMSVTWEVA